MIDHISSYATDFDASKAFYDAVLPVLGYACLREMTIDQDPDFPGRRLAAYGATAPKFWLAEVKAAASPRHVAFTAASPADVDAFHAAGLAVGAVDHGAPGPRPHYHPGYYGAFLIDPDGNNVEAVHHGHP
ncbi:MAG: VOC family protein [Alphaproteobacteria bacterium]|nr:VOC family protein [Alphaproteobacteria bacterium]